MPDRLSLNVANPFASSALERLYQVLEGHPLSQWASIYQCVCDMFKTVEIRPERVDKQLIKDCIYELLFSIKYQAGPWQKRFYDLAMHHSMIIWPELTKISDPTDQYLFIKEQQLCPMYMELYIKVTKGCLAPETKVALRKSRKKLKK